MVGEGPPEDGAGESERGRRRRRTTRGGTRVLPSYRRVPRGAKEDWKLKLL